MTMNRKLENELITCITEHKENVYRLAYSYVKNQEDALDIVQEAIQKAFAASDSLKNNTSIKSWFYRIVVNTCLDFCENIRSLQLVAGLITSPAFAQTLSEMPVVGKWTKVLTFRDYQYDEVHTKQK